MIKKLNQLLLVFVLLGCLILCSCGTQEVEQPNDRKYEIYKLAAETGYTGTYEEWLNSISGREIELQVSLTHIEWRYVGENSWRQLTSLDRIKGDKGTQGNNGLSAYEIAVELGYRGTVNEWLATLKGNDGLSAYEIYLKYHPEYKKSEEEWIEDLMNKEINDAEKEYCTVTFELNNGEDPQVVIVESGSHIEMPKTPLKGGHKFVEWYYEEEDVKWIFAGFTVSQDITLVAKWEKDTSSVYNIKWDLFTTLPLNMQVESDIDIPDTFNSYYGIEKLPVVFCYNPAYPELDEYVFAGWYDNPSLSGNPVTSIPVGTCHDVSLYAKWVVKAEQLYFSITYICEGGTLPENAPTSYVGGIGTVLPIPTPNNEGEEFLGWYLDGYKVDKISSSNYRDIIIVAKFGFNVVYNGKWTFNNLGFVGNGMTFEIKVLPVTTYDPFDPNFSGTNKNQRQEHQTEVEDAYDIIIDYTNWPDDAPWGPERVKYIHKKYLQDDFGDTYVVNIASWWIPTLVRDGSIAELYDLDSETGIFAGLNNEFDDNSGYEQDHIINQATSVNNKVYGYLQDVVRPDYFMYYNVDKVKSLGIEDPAELWMKGEWTISNFDEWVKNAQSLLGSDEYVLDMGFAESIIAMTGSMGNRITNSNPPLIYLTSKKVTDTIEILQGYYNGGYYSTRSVQDVAPGFQAGKTLLHSGNLWFMKEPTRFNPAIMNFIIGVVPYPTADGEGGIPVTTKDTSNAISIGNNEYLTDSYGNYIQTVDMSESSFKVPYTGVTQDCYSVLNIENGKYGMNSEIATHILHDLLRGYNNNNNNSVNPLTKDEEYRNWLETKFDREIDVEVVMSCQESTYFEMIELVSMTVADGSHFGPDGFWPLASTIVRHNESPAAKLNEVLSKYKQAMRDIGYNVL